MRQRELLDFRTPQHPSIGTNKWGGASPLLARNIPKESLEQRYLKLNAIRDKDQIFPSTTIEVEIFSSPPPATIGDEIFRSSRPDSSEFRYRRTPWREGFFRKLMWRRRRLKERSTLGASSWFPKWDPKKRWPNGWY
ncbi:hypothetical protein CDL12_23425 [Handroanthus impetiginosus]|uniref:Uncharacterized protein n=1 Tax=Handroanthus impetiginosus TaxID=429701 RepID=A0A2G9GFH3_9LAMI|nr:hypothetical protein CDL12_23425 [Handroanthus impetiginosus]